MFGGGGGLNPRKMKQMMEQMGIDLEELDARRVAITLEDGDRLVFDDADVTRMDARGQQTYQIVGEPERTSDAESTDADESEGDETDDSGVPDEDVELVVQRTGATSEEAREALAAENGDLAAAISRLE